MEKRRGLSGNQLKVIAIVAMTVDHLTWVIWPGCVKAWWVLLLHIVGRLTAPIMWFFVAEGFHYTRSAKRYALRLLVFALISHFAYAFAFGNSALPFRTTAFNQTSVIWALFLGVCALMLLGSEKLAKWQKLALFFLLLALAFCADWSCIAVLAVVYIHEARGNFGKQMGMMMLWAACYALVYFLFLDRVYGVLQLFVALSIPLLAAYDGTRGKWKGMKWFFYAYYPAHLVACGALRLLLHGNVSVLFG